VFDQIKVPVKNLLYMYSYAWDMVSSQQIIQLAAEDNFTSSDIFAELFLINAQHLLKRGLHRQYVERADDLDVARGKIDLIETKTKFKLEHGCLHCEFDELTEDILFNQILKYIAAKLYHCQGLSHQHKKSLRQVLMRFQEVKYKEITLRDLESLVFNRMNIYYSLMIKICELIIKSSMLTSKSGDFSFDKLFQDEKELNRLFELFVCNFYKKELPTSYKIGYQNILKWNFIGGNQNLLPNLKTDIQVASVEETLVIDTKFYKTYTVENYGTKKFRSGHIYQMISYLYNINCNNSLRGILLYPQPYDEPKIRESYRTQILAQGESKDVFLQICTVNLGNDWSEIRRELLDLI